MSSYTLTENSLALIMEGGKPIQSPIMQILNSKRAVKENNIISDGKNFISNAGFTTQSNKMASEEITKFTIIQINKYSIKPPRKGENSMIEIIDYEILGKGDEVNERIGSPKRLSGSLPESNFDSIPEQQNITNQNTTAMQVTHTISSLKPELKNWVIKARIVEKSDIKPWLGSKKNKSNYFSIHLADETGEIRAIAFKHLVDKFYNHILVDDEYFISKCELKTSTKSFSKIEHDYEMVLTDESVIQLDDYHTDDAFIKIKDIPFWSLGRIIDANGICKDIGDLRPVKFKGEKTRLLRNITLSNRDADITVTLWDLKAKYFRDHWLGLLLTFKNITIVGDCYARTLSVEQGCYMRVDPEVTPKQDYVE